MGISCHSYGHCLPDLTIRRCYRGEFPRQNSGNQVTILILSSSLLIYFPFCPQSLGAYNVSKTALLGLTKTLAVELAPKNIRVNCLVPGFIKTDFSRVVSTEKSSYTTGH